MSERTWKDWTRTDWYNAAYCDHCGLPLLEIADNEAGTRGHYECIYCTWMDDHDVETNSLRAQVAALQAALEEEGRRNAVFTACLHKAQNLYLEAHPDYPGWPDGAVNITWVLEAFDKERAEVKRLQTALAAANEDAERLAAGDGSVTSFHITYCRYCSKGFERGSRTQEIRHAANCPITLHRARVGGAS